MCNSCSLAAGLLDSLIARQLSRLTAWQLRGARVPRAGLGQEDFILLKPYRFGYRSVIGLGDVFPRFFC